MPRTKTAGSRTREADGLTPVERDVVEAYLNPDSPGYMSKSEAYRQVTGTKAKPDTVQQYAYKLFKRDVVLEYLERRRAEQRERVDINTEWALGKLVEIVNWGTSYDLAGRMRDAKAANTALGLIAKHVGGFNDKLEVTGEGGGPVQFAVVRRTPGLTS